MKKKSYRFALIKGKVNWIKLLNVKVVILKKFNLTLIAYFWFDTFSKRLLYKDGNWDVKIFLFESVFEYLFIRFFLQGGTIKSSP